MTRGLGRFVGGGNVAYNPAMGQISDYCRRRLILRLLLALAGAALAGASSGCTGITVATLGSVAGAVGSAFDTGNDIYHLGKIDTAEMARYVDAMAATRAAAKDLRLKGRLDRQSPDGTADFSFEDDKGAPGGVHIERR